MGQVIVCGSLNMDVVVQNARRPSTGETVLGAKVSLLPGGKGLNQAVAAARLGATTTMLGAVGDDVFGRALHDVLADNDIDTSGVRIVRGETTGVAVIHVDRGDNAIIGASGANALLTSSIVRRSPRPGETWLAQFETPIATTEAAFRKARQCGARTILNLAPMVPYPPRLLKLVDIAIVNEIELAQATGTQLTARSSQKEIGKVCQKLRDQGASVIIATLGKRGAFLITPDCAMALSAFKVPVVDATGAGDCFVGALASRMAAGWDVVDAARYGIAAVACSVQQLGAAPSMPTPEQVANKLKSQTTTWKPESSSREKFLLTVAPIRRALPGGHGFASRK